MDRLAVQITVDNNVIHSGVTIKRHTPIYVTVNIGGNVTVNGGIGSDDDLEIHNLLLSGSLSMNDPSKSPFAKKDHTHSTTDIDGYDPVDILGYEDDRSPSDENVMSALRTINEILQRSISKTNPDTAAKVITFIEGLISQGLIEAKGGIKLPSGAALYSLYENGLLAFSMDENGFVIYEKGTANKWSVITSTGAEFQNLVIKFLAQITDLEVSNKTTTLDLVVQALAKTYNLTVDNTADIMHGIIREYLTSESFVSGFLGSGFKIWKDANGDWNGEFDKLTVRKIFTIFELVVQKVVHQGGMVIRSAAGGRLKKVTDGGTYWKCEHDSTDDFLPDDQVLCQTFTGTSIKRYWRKVTSAGAGYFNLSKTDCEAGSATPEVGDNVAVLGNRTNTDRQSAQIDCAVGFNAPYRDDYAGVNSYSLEGKLINRTGNLSGVTDPDFGVLSGSGLYGSNVYLKGIFRLLSGKTVETAISDAQSESNAYTDGKITTIETNFEIREGQISSKVTQATTAATQASGYATSASGSASTATTKATAASNSANAAAGSATTAGQKAADAAGSATAAQDAADDAATVLSQVTTKESSINQTASNITLQVSEVTTKVTTATNAANTATTKAGEASTSATNAANSANQASNILTTVVQKETSINQTAQAIELKAVRAESAAGRAESAEASINLKADGIVLQASSQAAQSAINGVQAGGENLLRNGDFASYSTNNSIGWDNSLNGTYAISHWGSGYNSGVDSPTIGYHAHLNTSKFGWPVLEFINKNSIYNLSHRWMGICSYVYKKEKLLPGQQYTFSADVMIDTAGMYIHGGLYSARIGSSTSYYFYSGQYTLAPVSINTWQRVSYTFTLDANIDLSQGVSFYIYGYSGAEGIAWVKNVSLQLGNKGSYVRCDADVDVDAQTKANAAESNAKSYANSTFTTKTEFSSQLSVLNNSISAKVSQTDFNSLSTRVTSAEQKITSDAIISTVSSTITTAKNEAINAAAADATTKANNAKSSAISTAATDATTKANTAESNAKTYSNNTFTSLTTYNTKIAQLESSISLKADSTTVNGINTRLSSAEAKITSDAINLTVQSQVIDTAISYSNLAAKLAGAKMLFIDPAFKESMNSINVYNNNNNGTVTIGRVPRHSDNPTASNYQIKIVASGFSQTPGRGGFYFGNYAQPYAEYICKFIAWVPTNCSIVFGSNSMGSGGYQKWLTPTQGQGKWAEYVSYVRAGDGGNSSTNFYHLNNSTDETVTWWLCYATVFDCSKNEYTPDVYAIKSGISITTGGISIFGQTLSFAGKVTFSSLDSSTQSTINGKATTNYVDTVKSTAESALANAGTANQSIGTLQSNLGQMAYQNMVSLAKLDSTIVEGGYIKTSLIDANAIITGSLLAAKIAATDITTTRLTVSEGCTVGGFAIGNGRIGSIASATGSGGELAIYSNFFRVGGSDGYVMLGNNVIPATAGGAFNATGRIVNQTVNQGAYWGYDACNTGLYISVSGGTKNFGIDSNAALKAPAFINTRVKYLVFGTSYLIDLSQYSVFMCYAASAKSVIMPDETSIAKQFSLSSLPSDFGCIFTFHVIGGSSDITLNNVIDWNMSSINLRLVQGDSVQLLVTKFPNFHYQVINHTD